MPISSDNKHIFFHHLFIMFFFFHANHAYILSLPKLLRSSLIFLLNGCPHFCLSWIGCFSPLFFFYWKLFAPGFMSFISRLIIIPQLSFVSCDNYMEIFSSGDLLMLYHLHLFCSHSSNTLRCLLIVLSFHKKFIKKSEYCCKERLGDYTVEFYFIHLYPLQMLLETMHKMHHIEDMCICMCVHTCTFVCPPWKTWVMD